MSKAMKFVLDNTDANYIMTALDKAGIESEQDFGEGSTTWHFNDNSEIVVCGTEVTLRG